MVVTLRSTLLILGDKNPFDKPDLVTPDTQTLDSGGPHTKSTLPIKHTSDRMKLYDFKE